MDTSFEQQVRERAYAIWMAEGQTDGMAHEHWVAAEQALVGETATPVEKAVTKKAAAKPVAAKQVASKTAKVSAKKAAPTASAKTVVAKAAAAKAKPASELRH